MNDKQRYTCRYLDGNEMGMAMLYGKYVTTCCDKFIELMPAEDFSKVNVPKLMSIRKDFIEGLNNGTIHDCDGCPSLKQKDISDIDEDHFSWMNIGNFTTCNLRCKYCYYGEQELGAKLEPEKTYIMPILKNFYDANVLRDDFCLAIAGGEPTLFQDIPEALKFLEKNFKNPKFNLQSNSSIISRINKIKDSIKNANLSWKNLYTSVDAGTRETYKNIRGQDLFYDVTTNLLMYAKEGVFTEMGIKYMLLDNNEKNMYNLSLEDIYGFCNLLKQISKYKTHKTVVYIDRDMKDSCQNMSDKMLKAGGIITYAAKKLGIDCIHSSCKFINQQDSDYMYNFAENYEQSKEKTNEEKYLLALFLEGIKGNDDNIDFKNLLLERIFSIKKSNNHKIINILGIKIKFRIKR